MKYIKRRETQRWNATEKRYKESVKDTDILLTTQSTRNSTGRLLKWKEVVSDTHVSASTTSKNTLKIPYANVKSVKKPSYMTGSIYIILFCKKYPHAQKTKSNSVYIEAPTGQVNNLIRNINDSLRKWRSKYGEFYGTDWQTGHYGKFCQ